VLAALLASASLGCPSSPKDVVYDLARRLPVAERWSARDVVLFGTPGAEPHEADGFYREAAGEGFVWSKDEAELSLTWPQPAARAAVVDIAPYRGVKGQSVKVRLNDTDLGGFALNDLRHRYRLSLPAAAQRPGENRLRFTFAAAAAPADLDPQDTDRRRLAAAFYSLTVGPEGDAGLDDLLAREAPDPFAVSEAAGLPSLVQVGPSVIRYAVRLPPGAELRFTPDLHPAARAAAASASFRVTIEARPGEEREIWGRVIGPRDGKAGEVSLALPGEAGDIVRIGLHVGAAPGARFAWGTWASPRILGRGGADPLSFAAAPASPTPGGDALRKALAGSNVLLIVLDAGRARELGCYGYGRPTTPEIDRLAREGVVFDRAYTPAVYTLAAMSSVWTSEYPDRHHGAVSFSSRLPRSRLTLPEILTPRGILTAGFVANAVAGTMGGFDRGFAEFHELYRNYGSGAGAFQKALPAWLRANKDRRFFAYLHFREPHFPYDPEPPFDTRFGPEGPIPKAQRREMGWITEVNQGRRTQSAEERDHLVRLYDGNLAFADQEIGALRRALEAEGLLDRTVVMVMADHGEGLGEHGWIGHNVQLYEESIHIPLVFRFPAGKGPAGKRIGGLVDLLDLAPTVADVFGVLGQGGSDKQFQGRSLLPVVEGAPGKSAVLSRTVWDRPRYALRDLRFKFLYDTRSGEEELFDLEADPAESRNVAAADPLRAAYFRQALHQWIAGLGRRAGAAEEGALTPEQRENLCALGYLQCR
jgi:arylsulfatase A-like enzyme